MKMLEKFRQMVTGETEYKGKLARFEEELRDREAKQGGLEKAALLAEVRDEIMGEANAPGLKKTAKEAEVRIGVLRYEIEKAKQALNIFAQEKGKLEGPAIDEIQDQYRPEMEKALKNFLKCLRETAMAETRIKELTESVNDAARNAGIQRTVTLEPTGTVLPGAEDLRRMSFDRGGFIDLSNQAITRCRMNDYDVD